jgi:hypothetical protein
MLDRVFQDDERNVDSQPMVGIYRCLYCGRCFSLKRLLKLHYQQIHSADMPNYGSEKADNLLAASKTRPGEA